MTKNLFRNMAWLLAASLAACAQPFNGPGDTTDERLIYPLTVAPHMESLRVPAGGLTTEMDGRLTAFAKDYLEHGNGALSVTVPMGDESSRRFYASRLSDLGVPAWRMMINGTSTDGGVELSYIRYAAAAPPCGDWSRDISWTSANLNPPNFGCATQHNIAVMVADPRDIVAAHRSEPGDATRRMTVFDKYRKGEPTPTQRMEEQKATVAEVK